MPTQFSIEVDNRPGEIGKLASALGDRGVNIRGLASDIRGNKGIVHCLVNNEDAARKALRDAKYAFREREALLANVENKPGTLGQLGKNLGSAGVNIETLFPVPAEGGKVQVALTVDKPDKAKTIVR